MKFKVGEKVRVKEGIKSTYRYGVLQYDGYRIEEDIYSWEEDWLEPIEIKKLKLRDFLK